MKNEIDIVVVDGQGGGVGKAIIEAIKKYDPECFVLGIGTNTVATNNLKKGGANAIATGENAIIYNCERANIIIGPIGISFANSMYGEISPAMAKAINESDAMKYLLPISKCRAPIVGVESKTLNEYIQDLITLLK